MPLFILFIRVRVLPSVEGGHRRGRVKVLFPLFGCNVDDRRIGSGHAAGVRGASSVLVTRACLFVRQCKRDVFVYSCHSVANGDGKRRFRPFVAYLSACVRQAYQDFVRRSVRLVAVDRPDDVSGSALLLLCVALFFFRLVACKRLFCLGEGLPGPRLLFFPASVQGRRAGALSLGCHRVPEFSCPRGDPYRVLSLMLFRTAYCRVSRR